MPLIIWKDSYCVGISEIDTQHQKLVLIINNLFDSISKKERTLILEQSLNELINYTLVHFKTEEEEMRNKGFFAYAFHKSEHDSNLYEINSIFKEFENNKDIKMLKIYFENNLVNWLLNHIQTMSFFKIYEMNLEC